jgi:chitinase|tara:strand:+ start:12326 stop:13666 length:1341 start_codon:yes stop_codon:yes gene_type:complete
MKFLQKLKLLTILLIITSSTIQAQLPSKVLVGYWENWGTLRLKDVDTRYNVLCLSFLEADKGWPATPLNNVVGDLEFTPTNKAALKQDIPIVQAQGKIVLISIGGGNGSFRLNNLSDKNTFIQKVKDFIDEYQVDGIDIDLEQGTYVCATESNISNPQDAHIKNLIAGIKEIMSWYKTKYNKKLILTMAPETTYVQGGLSNWSVNNICGGDYLAIIEQLRDEIDLLMVQLYNSGSILDLNGKEQFENSVDFPISATETVIRGFTAKGGMGVFSGLPEEKIVVGLTTCASDQAYFNKTEIKSIINYLLGSGAKPGNYTLKNSYPNLKGLMTWSINTDAKMSSSSSCNPSVAYDFAQAFEDIFGTINNSVIEAERKKLNIYPNPASNQVSIDTKELIGEIITISDLNGRIVKNLLVNNSNTIIYINDLSNGFYTVKSSLFIGKIIVKK